MTGPGQHADTVRGLRNLIEGGYSYCYAVDCYLRKYGLNLIDEHEALAERTDTLEREVQRLRALHLDRTKTTHSDLTSLIERAEAAEARVDTLKRERDMAYAELEGENYILRSTHDAITGSLHAEAMQAGAEADRLREALREIEAKDTGAHFAGEPRMSDIARAALAGPPTEGQT